MHLVFLPLKTKHTLFGEIYSPLPLTHAQNKDPENACAESLGALSSELIRSPSFGTLIPTINQNKYSCILTGKNSRGVIN